MKKIFLTSFVSLMLFCTALGEERPVSESVKQTQFYQLTQKNPELAKEFAMSAKLIPMLSKSGTIKGFRFLRIEEGSKWSKWGLRNEDRVTEIDGQEITTLDDLLAVYLKYDSNDKVSFKKDNSKN